MSMRSRSMSRSAVGSPPERRHARTTSRWPSSANPWATSLPPEEAEPASTRPVAASATARSQSPPASRRASISDRCGAVKARVTTPWPVRSVVTQPRGSACSEVSSWAPAGRLKQRRMRWRWPRRRRRNSWTMRSLPVVGPLPQWLGAYTQFSGRKPSAHPKNRTSAAGRVVSPAGRAHGVRPGPPDAGAPGAISSPEAIGRRQSARIRSMVAHAYEGVPYYRETMRRLGLTPADIASAEDLRKLPLIERAQLQRDPEQFMFEGRQARFCVATQFRGQHLGARDRRRRPARPCRPICGDRTPSDADRRAHREALAPADSPDSCTAVFWSDPRQGIHAGT